MRRCDDAKDEAFLMMEGKHGLLTDVDAKFAVFVRR
jgi:hypothetical protein